jgi:hypothetical protein
MKWMEEKERDFELGSIWRDPVTLLFPWESLRRKWEERLFEKRECREERGWGKRRAGRRERK